MKYPLEYPMEDPGSHRGRISSVHYPMHTLTLYSYYSTHSEADLSRVNYCPAEPTLRAISFDLR